MAIQKETLISEIIKGIEQESIAVFVGAGLSVPAGFVDWKGLLTEIAKEIKLDIENESHDLVALSQYYMNENGRSKLNDILRENFSILTRPTHNHKLLATLPIDTYWTVNYDKLIEEALKENKKLPDVKYRTEQMLSSIPFADATVYKMHGDIEHVDKTVLTKHDYETYNKNYSYFKEMLESHLISKTFLFLGLSFNDPNLNYITSHLSSVLNYQNQRTHYWITKRVSSKDYLEKDEDLEYIYDRTKQELQINDLKKRYSIRTHLIDEYSEITDIICDISNRLKSKNIFISGSAVKYDGFDNEIEARQFIFDLSSTLIKNGYKLVTGYGLGVGDYVVNGAITSADENLSSQKQRKNSIKMYPFPQGIQDKIQREDTWKKYREDILSDVGFAIYIFGNKKDDMNQNIVDSYGVYEEYIIAREKNVITIPVGLTGSMSKKIYDDFVEIINDKCNNPEIILPLLEKISNRQSGNEEKLTNEEIIDVILEIILKYKIKF